MSKKNKILFIEDDPFLLNNVTEILELNNFEVKTAVKGDDGINLALEWEPDLILCDIALPQKNGYEILEELSKSEQTKSIPFIFLTAKVEKEDLRKGMQLGADDYIFKPFSEDDLLHSIGLRIRKRKEIEKSILHTTKTEDNKYEIGDKIAFKEDGNINFYRLIDIKYIIVEAPYVKFKLNSGKSILDRDSLNHWEKRLPSDKFIRIHQSTIINIKYLSKVEKISSTSFHIWISNENKPFPISKRYIPKVRSKLLKQS